jgi:hypothetical protein
MHLLEGLRSPGVFFIRFLRIHPREVRVFLRGNVARAADFTGSGLLLAAGTVEPRMLSLLAAPFVALWITMALYLKRIYPALLIRSLA